MLHTDWGVRPGYLVSYDEEYVPLLGSRPDDDDNCYTNRCTALLRQVLPNGELIVSPLVKCYFDILATQRISSQQVIGYGGPVWKNSPMVFEWVDNAMTIPQADVADRISQLQSKQFILVETTLGQKPNETEEERWKRYRIAVVMSPPMSVDGNRRVYTFEGTRLTSGQYVAVSFLQQTPADYYHYFLNTNPVIVPVHAIVACQLLMRFYNAISGEQELFQEFERIFVDPELFTKTKLPRIESARNGVNLDAPPNEVDNDEMDPPPQSEQQRDQSAEEDPVEVEEVEVEDQESEDEVPAASPANSTLSDRSTSSLKRKASMNHLYNRKHWMRDEEKSCAKCKESGAEKQYPPHDDEDHEQLIRLFGEVDSFYIEDEDEEMIGRVSSRDYEVAWGVSPRKRARIPGDWVIFYFPKLAEKVFEHERDRDWSSQRDFTSSKFPRTQ
jgi:hypothetical protein